MSTNDLITLNTVIARNDTKFLANKIGEEMVMMNMESGNFIAMNPVGAEIWSLSEKAIAVKDIIIRLMEIYEITEEQCINETTEFLNRTTSEQLFIIENVAIS